MARARNKGTVDTPLTEVRRRDRAVEDDHWIVAFLHRAPYGILAMAHGNQPFINSNLFVYDQPNHVIYTHTARVGRTRATVESNSRVCFSVSQMGRLLPAREALEFSVEYAGVTVFGRAFLVEDPLEAEHGLQLLLDKYAPHLHAETDYRPITRDELKRTAVYRIEIDAWSGKKKEVEADFPGAYFFGDHTVWRAQEHHRPGFLISTDRNRLDLNFIFDFLASEAYWSSGITREVLARYVQHSLCFGLFALDEGEARQIGFGRVITDFTTFAHLADIFVAGAYRSQGLGTWLVTVILAHPELQGLRQWSLNTRDQQPFYEQFGFRRSPRPDNYMVLRPGKRD